MIKFVQATDVSVLRILWRRRLPGSPIETWLHVTSIIAGDRRLGTTSRDLLAASADEIRPRYATRGYYWRNNTLI